MRNALIMAGGLALLIACATTSSNTGSGGSSGAGATGGTSGSGGSSASGGASSGGSSASGGASSGGSSASGGASSGGTTGSGGSAGSTGSGGSAGSTGSGGSAGSTGSGGSAGSTGSGGSAGSTGSGGSAGSTGSGGSGGCNNPCILSGDGTCGAYDYSKITNSNGYNTYVGNQMWGCGSGNCGPETLAACNPGLWTVTSNQAAGNTAVLTYPDVQQLFNDWYGSGFSGSGTPTDTPISGLAALVGTYSENMHENSGTAAEAAYDIWTSSGEVMIWVDTTQTRGSGGAQQIDTGTLGGLPFTFYVYGGTGGLPIIKLNTNQRSGTIDVLAGLHWLQQHGYVANNGTLSQVNFGWEICSTGGVDETFDVTSYSLTATPN